MTISMRVIIKDVNVVAALPLARRDISHGALPTSRES